MAPINILTVFFESVDRISVEGVYDETEICMHDIEAPEIRQKYYKDKSGPVIIQFRVNECEKSIRRIVNRRSLS